MYILEKTLQHSVVKKKRSPLWLNIIRACAVLCAILLVAGLLFYKGSYRSDHSTVCFLDDTLQATANGSFERQRLILKDYLEEAPSSLMVSLLGQSGRHEPWLNAKEALQVLSEWESGYRSEDWRRVSLKLGRLFRQRPTAFVEVKSAFPLRAINVSLANAILAKRSGQIKWSSLEGDHARDEYYDQFQFRVITKAGRYHFSSPLLGSAQQGKLADQWSFVLKNDDDEFLISRNGQELEIETEADICVYKGDQELPFLRRYLIRDPGLGNRCYFMRDPKAQKRLQDPGHYIEQALIQVCGNKGWDLGVVPSHRWDRIEPKRGDVLLLHDPSYLSDADAVSLERFVELGVILFFMPGPSSSLEMIDRLSFLPARVLSPPGLDFVVKWPADFCHSFPLFSKESFSGGFLFQKLDKNAQVHATTSSGEPMWISMERGDVGGRVHLMPSLFHMNWSKAVLQPAFPSVLQWILSHHMTDPSPRSFVAGDKMPSDVVAISWIRGDVHSEDLGLPPGVQRWTYEDGREENVVINVDMDRLKKRGEVRLPNQWSFGEGASRLSQGLRLDPWITLMFGFCCLAEAGWLYYRPRFD